MSSSDEKVEQGVDLGLSAMLEQVEEGVRVVPEAQLNVLSDQNGDSTRSPDGVYERIVALADKRDWSELRQLAEEHLSHLDPLIAVAARFYWVQAHRELATLPSTILVPSVETALDGLGALPASADQARVFTLGVGVTRDLCEALHQASDGELCLTLAEKALQLDPTIGVDLERWGRDYRARLESRERGVGLTSAEKLRLRTLQERTIGDSSDQLRGESEPKKTVSEPSIVDLATQRSDRRSYRSRLAPGLFLCFLGMVLWGGVGILFRGAGDREGGEGIVARTSIALEKAKLKLPKGNGAQAPRELDSLVYSLAVTPTASQRSGDTPARVTPEVVPSRPGPVEFETPPLPQREAVKPSVNTSGPLEREIIAAPPPSRRGPIDRSDGSANLPETIERNSPFDANASTIFTNGKMYMVVTNTRVLEAPNFRAALINELNPGDRVMVEEKRGFWLRIRSPKGKVGFILAQDAEELEQFRR